jgi:DNA mismatch repair protein MLH3
MFNDPLTREQCSDLVRRVAACAFPFQCAHGRPSMVPLVHLGQSSELQAVGEERGEAAGALLGALKRWKRDLETET